MKLIPLQYIVFMLIGFPFTGIAQDLIPPQSIQNEIISFGWESFTEEFSTQNKNSSFSILVEVSKKKSIEMDFGFTAKQINSTSQWNHFSIHRDTRGIQLLKRLDPNRNYPNHAIYRSNLSCQPYPLIEVNIFKDVSFGI
ncbi:hypothetical protein [Mesonia sp.]|uniref:hypothetical protein n=1 Tax=Mesonia sp. TaxID=1960830 RepID=UPI003F9AE9FE